MFLGICKSERLSHIEISLAIKIIAGKKRKRRRRRREGEEEEEEKELNYHCPK